jgi:hypothetical protein
MAAWDAGVASALPAQFELDMASIQYVYRIPLPAWASRPLENTDTSRLPAILREYYAQRASDNAGPRRFDTVADFFKNGYSIMGCCLWRLANLHRLLNCATHLRDGAFYHQVQLLIDSHLSLWTECVSRGTWSDEDLLRIPVRCVVHSANASRIPDIRRPEHPYAPAKLTERGFALAAAAGLKLHKEDGTPVYMNQYAPEWFTRRVVDAMGTRIAAMPRDAQSSSSSSTSTAANKDAFVEISSIAYSLWPLSTDVVTWEEAPDLSPYFVRDAVTYESALDGTGAAERVGAPSAFATSSGAGTRETASSEYSFRANIVRLFVTRVLPHRSGGRADYELPKKCVEAYPVLGRVVMNVVGVSLLGNHPYIVDRPHFGARVRIVSAIRDSVGLSHGRILRFIEARRALVERALMEHADRAICMLPSLERVLRERPKHGTWSLATRTNAAFIRHHVSRMPLFPTVDESTDEYKAYASAQYLRWSYVERVLAEERKQIIKWTAEKSRKGSFVDMLLGKMRKIVQLNMRDASAVMRASPQELESGRIVGVAAPARRGGRLDSDDDDDDDEGNEEEEEEDDETVYEYDGDEDAAARAAAGEQEEPDWRAWTTEEELLALLDKLPMPKDGSIDATEETVERHEAVAAATARAPHVTVLRRIREAEETAYRQRLYDAIARQMPAGYDFWLAHMLAERAARLCVDRRKIEWWPLLLLGVHPAVVQVLRQFAAEYALWDRPDNSYVTDVEWLWRAFPRSWAGVFFYLSLYVIYSRDHVYLLSREVTEHQRSAIHALYRCGVHERIPDHDLRYVFHRCPVCDSWSHPVAPLAALNFISDSSRTRGSNSNNNNGTSRSERHEYVDPVVYTSETRLRVKKKYLVSAVFEQRLDRARAIAARNRERMRDSDREDADDWRDTASSVDVDDDDDDHDDSIDDADGEPWSAGSSNSSRPSLLESRRDPAAEARMALEKAGARRSAVTLALGIRGKVPVTHLLTSAGHVENAASSQASMIAATGASMTTDSAGLYSTGIVNAHYDIACGRLRCALPASRRQPALMRRALHTYMEEDMPLYDIRGTKKNSDDDDAVGQRGPTADSIASNDTRERVLDGETDTGWGVRANVIDDPGLRLEQRLLERLIRYRALADLRTISKKRVFKTETRERKQRLRQQAIEACVAEHAFNRDLSKKALFDEYGPGDVHHRGSTDMQAQESQPVNRRHRLSYLEKELRAKARADVAEKIHGHSGSPEACNAWLQPVHMLGKLVMTRGRVYCLCCACGSLMVYTESCWVPGYGPVCQLHGVTGGGFDVKTGTLIPSPFASSKSSQTVDKIAAPGAYRLRSRVYITAAAQLNNVPPLWLLHYGYRTPLEALARKRIEEFDGLLPGATVDRVMIAGRRRTAGGEVDGGSFEPIVVNAAGSMGFPYIQKATGVSPGANAIPSRAHTCAKCPGVYYMSTVITAQGLRLCLKHYVKLQDIIGERRRRRADRDPPM